MSEPIDPAGIQWLRVSPKLVQLRFLREGIGSLVILLLFALPLSFRLLGIWPGFPLWLAWLLLIGAAVVQLWRLLLIPRQVRALGFAERAEDLLIRRGLLFQKVLVVPYGRMQYVDVSVGPIERALGLATLKLHTASPGTNAAIEGLPAEQAARLREQLSSLGEAKLAGL
ncbi:PH domain-containing protein [Psychromicrobium lacuslunae]|uniref:Membrane protein n=1 Tax=Psychromicrobium lacuslunae TaxID=1618207 RepID=A0A0D4C1C6_9MICC|nr:PH domain-containing protein [Psychromicrobium lacuslunae]AJT42359.1 membrane protein [Psychromicrobium lacuslunae]